MNTKEELKNIRKQRKEGKIDKPQKRSVEIIEYEDGTFSLKGYAYNLPLQRDKEEIQEAINAWLNEILEKDI